MNTKTSGRIQCDVHQNCLQLAVGASYILLAVIVLGGCRREVPKLSEVIHVSMRQSSLEPTTAVLQIKNKHTESLTLYGCAVNLDNKQEVTFRIGTLAPGQSTELGILEIGWAFVPNERFLIGTTKDKPYRDAVFDTYRAESGSIEIKQIK